MRANVINCIYRGGTYERAIDKHLKIYKSINCFVHSQLSVTLAISLNKEKFVRNQLGAFIHA